MPALSFKGAGTTGHECFHPSSTIQGSSDCFVGNKPALRVGDKIAPHCDLCDDDHPCHDGAVAQGSSTLFINNKPAARIGDSIGCGDYVAQGEPTCQVG